ncbi:cytokine receptor common subunit beta [Syngnathoides biaculeatus]|uniref:cytokine receptor common subunit beta n=1 Tax=Syngnathoides biaculeatus TaxID=300417 RepID=UPI002ADE1C03|nr:cytokine receptor common subunit beta [Syngnathoides biaculeatus]
MRAAKKKKKKTQACEAAQRRSEGCKCCQYTHFPERTQAQDGSGTGLHPGTMPFFWMLLWLLTNPWTLLSHPDGCGVQEADSSRRDVLMELLQCHNDYESYVYCTWSEGPHVRPPLQLRFYTGGSSERCENFDDEVQKADQNRTVRCRYKTPSFSIGIQHTVFFVKDDTSCSPAPHKPLKLTEVRARAPADLSKFDDGDERLWLKWSSPYPTSSSLNKSLRYQVGYKAERQDTWTIMNTTSTEVKLETRLLLPGHMYEARVRARAAVGHWSHWSPLVTWRSKEDSGHIPVLNCVLDGEDKFMCSWEVSEDLDHIITYQLACGHNRTAPSESCCVNSTVTFDPRRPLVHYSCSLSVAKTAQLLLQLRPTRKAKTFRASKHIRPRPPHQVAVREKGNNWMVKWTEPSTASKIRLYYQVRYYETRDEQGSSRLLNVAEGSTSVNILGMSLSPFQHHRVQVRSVVIPGEGSLYEGSPSEWSKPAEWTSRAVSWPFTARVYSSISATVVIIVFMALLYCTISSCQRKIVIWVKTVPSPGKSKTLSEIKSATSWALMENENTYVSNVQQLYNLPTCVSPSPSLWPTEGAENKDLEQDRQDCKSNSLPPSPEKVNGCNLPVHFSGPYILCQPLDSKSMCEETKKNEVTSSEAPPFVVVAHKVEGYVCLPSGSVATSTSLWDAGENTQKHEQDHPSADKAAPSDKVLDIGPDGSDPPPAYGSESAWPAIRASGYCLLPPPS